MSQWLIEQRDNGRVDFTDEMILSGSIDDFDEETIETIKALINEYLRTMAEKELEGVNLP